MKDSDLKEVLIAQTKKIKELEVVIESMQSAMELIEKDMEDLSKLVFEGNNDEC